VRADAMKITIHTILEIRQALGQRLIEVDLPKDSTVEDLLAYMKKRWGKKLDFHLFNPDNGKVLDHLRIMVNGQTIGFLKGMDTLLKEKDEILIVPLLSGG
jgi:molybdopterin converting factor small subunit